MQYVETTLIFPLQYFNDTFCSMNICPIVSNSCIEATKCDIRLHDTVTDDNTKIIIGRSVNSQSFAITYCHQLEFQWMPKGLDRGNLIVTKEFEFKTEHEVSHEFCHCVYFVFCRINMPTFLLHVEMLK